MKYQKVCSDTIMRGKKIKWPFGKDFAFTVFDENGCCTELVHPLVLKESSDIILIPCRILKPELKISRLILNFFVSTTHHFMH